jgi:hypothetical protein
LVFYLIVDYPLRHKPPDKTKAHCVSVSFTSVIQVLAIQTKYDNPEIELKECGTSITVRSKCPSCNKEEDWHSQPYMPGNSQIKAGNFMLSLSMWRIASKCGEALQLYGTWLHQFEKYYMYQRVS